MTYKELKEIQEKHLERFKKTWLSGDGDAVKCRHLLCPECYGTGVKKGGVPCIHHISCSCPRCSRMGF